MNKIFYKIYHGNLAFSAIEEESLSEVIDKTYFPLLELIKRNNLKVGLELSGYSLEKIQELRPKWIEQFKKLYNNGLIELIGSGYMQIIGPITPYEINLENQRLGLQVYKDILDVTPQIAYINEQAFSLSLVDLYSNVGYKAIAMEWNNAYSNHKNNWKRKYSFNPVIAKGLNKDIPIIWTDTILFQQFQRMAHNEIDISEYIDIIKHHLDFGYNALPIYSSDLEIFNYRPGRFETEAILNHNEWDKIEIAMNKIKRYGNFYLPTEVLNNKLDKNIILDLTITSNPILVKKQTKYSLSRWAACGRGANYINTLCYNYFIHNGIDKKLLQYWGSDYRTHITIKKWNKAINFLTNKIISSSTNNKNINNDIILKKENNKLIFEKDGYIIIFNKSKGLTLDKVYKNNKKLQFGTVKHGNLDYISHGADFYTGTTIIESVETKKISDLYEIKDYSFNKIDINKYKISTIIDMKDIAVEEKSWIIDLENQSITLNIKLITKKFIQGSIRLGTLTLLSQKKDSNFWYECKNGGNNYERFYINYTDIIEHSQAKSLIQSSSNGIGVTDGILRFGINDNIICELKINQKVSYPFIMLQNSCDYNKYLTRVHFGIQEFDDTLKYTKNKEFKLNYTIKI